MTPDSVRLTRTIQAPPEEVYRAWTEPDRLRRWFGPDGFEVLEVELEARPGGRYRTAVTGPGGSGAASRASSASSCRASASWPPGAGSPTRRWPGPSRRCRC